MDFWDIFEYVAWGISAAIFFWMITDTLRVNREFDEDTLLSSREGSDELLEYGDAEPSEKGGH